MSTGTHVLTESQLASMRKNEWAWNDGDVSRLLATITALQAENKAVHANYQARLEHTKALISAMQLALDQLDMYRPEQARDALWDALRGIDRSDR